MLSNASITRPFLLPSTGVTRPTQSVHACDWMCNQHLFLMIYRKHIWAHSRKMARKKTVKTGKQVTKTVQAASSLFLEYLCKGLGPNEWSCTLPIGDTAEFYGFCSTHFTINSRIIQVGRDLCRWTSPNSHSWQGHVRNPIKTTCIMDHGWSALIVLTYYLDKSNCEVLSDSMLEYNESRPEGPFLKIKSPRKETAFVKGN